MRAKVLLLLAVCMAVLIGAEIPGTGLENARARKAVPLVRTTVSDVGVSAAYPKAWHLEREQYEYDGTRGFTLWKNDPNAADDHGGTPAARVALAVDFGRGQIESKVRQRISEFPELKLTRSRVSVGEKGLKGVAVGPIPGSTPSTEVYVADGDRVYQINVYGTKLDDKEKNLLKSLKFGPLSKSALSQNEKPDAGNPETFYKTDAATVERTRREEAAREGASSGEQTRSTMDTTRVPLYAESQIAEGCWLAASSFWVQTQHGYGANNLANDPGTDAPTGYTVVGTPNFWGQYTHGNLGYGRCVSTYYTNDKFAIDYPLNGGDVVFPPVAGGTVTFAGRNTSHKNYGIFVIIKADNGKYVSMSGHLSGLAPGIRAGARVTANTVIGYAGNTGDPSIPVGEVHLHQAFYRYPSFLADGSPYGGQGLQVLYHHYTGCPSGAGCGAYRPGGVYKFGWTATSAQKSKGSRISN